jgi:hypothetical protein
MPDDQDAAGAGSLPQMIHDMVDIADVLRHRLGRERRGAGLTPRSYGHAIVRRRSSAGRGCAMKDGSGPHVRARRAESTTGLVLSAARSSRKSSARLKTRGPNL